MGSLENEHFPTRPYLSNGLQRNLSPGCTGTKLSLSKANSQRDFISFLVPFIFIREIVVGATASPGAAMGINMTSVNVQPQVGEDLDPHMNITGQRAGGLLAPPTGQPAVGSSTASLQRQSAAAFHYSPDLELQEELAAMSEAEERKTSVPGAAQAHDARNREEETAFLMRLSVSGTEHEKPAGGGLSAMKLGGAKTPPMTTHQRNVSSGTTPPQKNMRSAMLSHTYSDDFSSEDAADADDTICAFLKSVRSGDEGILGEMKETAKMLREQRALASHQRHRSSNSSHHKSTSSSAKVSPGSSMHVRMNNWTTPPEKDVLGGAAPWVLD